jgi:hypothetical protein
MGLDGNGLIASEPGKKSERLAQEECVFGLKVTTDEFGMRCVGPEHVGQLDLRALVEVTSR